jgi:hypothetical protein
MPGYQTSREDIEGLSGESLSLSSGITHAGGEVQLTCTESFANVDVKEATLNAIKVDSLG